MSEIAISSLFIDGIASLMDTNHRSMLELHGFPVAWLQSTQKPADDNPVLGGGVDDCKTVGSPATAVVPLLVIHTHAGKLPHI